MPLTVHLLRAPQQEATQTPGFFDLPVHRLHDRPLLRRSLRLALGVDPGSLLASELAGHAGFGIGVPGQRSAFRRWWLAVRQPPGRDVGINTLISAQVGVALAPVARIQRHHIRQCAGAGSDPLQHGLQVSRVNQVDGWRQSG